MKGFSWGACEKNSLKKPACRLCPFKEPVNQNYNSQLDVSGNADKLGFLCLHFGTFAVRFNLLFKGQNAKSENSTQNLNTHYLCDYVVLRVCENICYCIVCEVTLKVKRHTEPWTARAFPWLMFPCFQSLWFQKRAATTADHSEQTGPFQINLTL